MEFKIIHIDETDSTNGWLRRADLTRCLTLCEVVVADYQTAGRGCGTNSWESERGKNLTFSVMLHPETCCSFPTKAGCQFRISEAVSVAMCETLEALFKNLREQEVTIKWPNDIYVGDGKVCGMLIENRMQGSSITDSIVGIGLNVNQQAFLSDAPNPVSLWQILGRETDREALLQAFLRRLSAVLSMDAEWLGEAYRSRLYRRDGFYAFEDVQGRFMAKVEHVLDDGRLVLLDDKGTARMYTFKEVRFVI